VTSIEMRNIEQSAAPAGPTPVDCISSTNTKQSEIEVKYAASTHLNTQYNHATTAQNRADGLAANGDYTVAPDQR